MLFQVRIQNLGKLVDANVRVGPLTVLAGVNNTGKSFCSKALYSVLRAGSDNHVRVVFQNLLRVVQNYLARIISPEMREREEPAPLCPPNLLTDFSYSLVGMESASKACSIALANEAFSSRMEMRFPEFEKAADTMKSAYEQMASSADHHARKWGANADFLPYMASAVDSLHKLGGMNGKQLIVAGLHHAMEERLLLNFQISEMLALVNDLDVRPFIKIDGIGEVIIQPDDYVTFDASTDGVSRLLGFSNALYLESPMMWRLRTALEDSRDFASFAGSALSTEKFRINGVSESFYDLVTSLRGEFSGKIPFPEIQQALTSDKIIGGNIRCDAHGGFYFEENGDRIFKLSTTSLGVTNLGILALLIEKKLVDKGTFLFIDEPESNLHPAWQVAMTEALWELARGGVNVVIATHSVDILKRLEIYAKEKDTKEDAANLIAVNHFQRDGTVQSGGVEKIRDIKRDLSAPFFKLYKRGLS